MKKKIEFIVEMDENGNISIERQNEGFSTIEIFGILELIKKNINDEINNNDD